MRLTLIITTLLALLCPAVAEEPARPPQTTQWILTVQRGSVVWTPGAYPTAERCRAARAALTRSSGWAAKCVELLGP